MLGQEFCLLGAGCSKPTRPTGVSPMSDYRTIQDIDVTDKRLLIRVDFNVPLEAGQVANDRRIEATLPTIRHALEHGAQVVLMTHLGRPGGNVEPALSLRPVAERLQSLLGGQRVRLVEDWAERASIGLADPSGGEIVLLENLRFHAGEKEADDRFCDRLAKWGDVYVNDAFAACHRQHASTHGVAKRFGERDRVIGLLVERELQAIDGLLDAVARPFVVVLGGVKVADKIGVVDRLRQRADRLCIGGAMAYTFLKAADQHVGQSKVEEERVEFAKHVVSHSSGKLRLPVDHVIAERPDGEGQIERAEGGIPDDWCGLDIGPKTIKDFTEAIHEAGTVIWNGPMGKFESEPFRHGTQAIVQALCATKARTLVGGGESIQALERFGDANAIDHVSTGGGAFLMYLKDRKLPALDVILQRQPHAEHAS